MPFVLVLALNTTSSRAVGFWKNRAEIAALWSAGHVFHPKAPAAAMRHLQAGWQAADARAKSA